MIFCSHKVFYFFCREQTTFILYHEKIPDRHHSFLFLYFIVVTIVCAAESDRCKKNDRTTTHFSAAGR